MNRLEALETANQITSSSLLPSLKTLTYQETVLAGSLDVGLYKPDSLGIGVAIGDNTGYKIFRAAPINVGVAMVNEYFKTYAVLFNCLTVNNSDAAQSQNDVTIITESISGNKKTQTISFLGSQRKSDFDKNVAYVNCPIVLTNRSFIQYNVASLPATDIKVSMTFSGGIAMTYSEFEAYMQGIALGDCGGNCNP